jgi:hypothetical protein
MLNFNNIQMKNQSIISKKNNKMYNIQNLNIVLVTALMLVISSCSPEFLEKVPLNELSAEGSYQTQSDAEAAIGACIWRTSQYESTLLQMATYCF